MNQKKLRTEAKGSGWAKALHPDDVQLTLEVWKKAVAAKTNYETEYRMLRHDGVYRYLLARGFPVFKADGSVLEWVGTCVDITERRQAEEEIRKLNVELEQRVKDRTAQLEMKIAEIERLNKLFVGRELRMVELKERIKELESGIQNPE